MSIRYAWTPMLLLLCALTACTAAPPLVGTTAAPAPRVVTGSLIASPLPDPALQVVTPDDITHTGRTDLGAALRQLVPSLQ
jgi:hypothetical protein